MDIVTLALSKNYTAQEIANLKEEIDARSDVVDIVNTYQDLVDYSKPITIDDIVKVLHDQAHVDEHDVVVVPAGAVGYYRYTGNTSDRWAYIGSVDGYYTKSEVYNKTEVDGKLDALDYTATDLGVNKTITSLTEVDGKIAATAEDISITSSQVSDKVGSIDNSTAIPTSNAVKTYVDGAIAGLDVDNITDNLGANKTITVLAETDGKISASASPIQIEQNQVAGLEDRLSAIDDEETGSIAGLDTKITNHIDASNNPHGVTKSQVGLGDVLNTSDSAIPEEDGEEKFTTGGAFALKEDLESKIDTAKSDAIAHADTAIAALDVATINNTAGKTISKLSETDGKVSVEFQDIAIAQSQVTNLETDLGAKYTKPGAGIPLSDLAQGVQDSIGLAHSHTNKALLDSYSQTEVNLADAVAKKHEHANASVLNDITAETVTTWDNKQDAIEDLDTIRSGAAVGTTAVQPDDLADVATSGSYDDLNDKPSFADVATSGDYNDLTNKPNLATVATTGSYTDLTNKPVIPAAQVQSDWEQEDSEEADYIKNKPTFADVAFTGDYGDLTNKPDLATVATSGSYNDLNDLPELAAVATSGSYNDLNDTPIIPTKADNIYIAEYANPNRTEILQAFSAGKVVLLTGAAPDVNSYAYLNYANTNGFITFTKYLASRNQTHAVLNTYYLGTNGQWTDTSVDLNAVSAFDTIEPTEYLHRIKIRGVTYAIPDAPEFVTNDEVDSMFPEEVSTVEAMVDALTDNSIKYIALEDDISASGSFIVNDAEKVIDLNGNTLQSTNSNALSVSNGASLTINGDGEVKSQEFGVVATYGSTLVVNDGTFTATDNCVLGTNGTVKPGDDRGHNTIEINGGTFNAHITTPGYIACGVYAANSDHTILNGGTFNIYDGCGICVRSGLVEVPDTSKVIFNFLSEHEPSLTAGKVGDSPIQVPVNEAFVLDLKANYPGGSPSIKLNGITYNSENIAAARAAGIYVIE